MLQAHRWLPGRKLVVVGDSSFAALELLAAFSRRGVACITRLRLDAALYDPAPPRLPGTVGRPQTKGRRLPTLAAVLTDSATSWERVTGSVKNLGRYTARWRARWPNRPSSTAALT